MRQWWVVPGEERGRVEQRDVEVPAPQAGEVRVRVTSAGVNRGELIAARALRVDNPQARPQPSGIEFAGVVDAVGSGVVGWSPGDRVMGRGRACHAEYLVAPAAALMASPPNLDDVEAGAVPNVFVTAHDALVTTAAIGSDDVVVITAGPSGVGTAAVQIAAHLGCRAVIATTRSPHKAETLLDLGATAVVDTRDPGWAAAVAADHGPVDAVIDQVGGRLFPELLHVLGIEGRYVSVGRNDGPTATIDLDLVARQRLRLLGVTFRTRTPEEALACTHRFAADLLSAFDDGALRPVVDRAFPLDALPEAHAHMASDVQIGKVVLVP